MTTNLTSNATSWDGDWEDGPQDDWYLPLYDPTAPVYNFRPRLELSVFCIAYGIAAIVIAARTYLRWKKNKKLQASDWWIVSGGVFLVTIYWPCLLAANYYGSGYHWKNVPENNRRKFWIATWGFSGYYIVTSLVKVSICCGHIALLPPDKLVGLRRSIKALCVFILALGIVETLLWNVGCVPFAANWDWQVSATYCVDLDIPRYLWVALSVVIDVIIIWIPFHILKGTRLRPHEKKVLLFVFSANSLATLACLAGLYGVYTDRSTGYTDSIYTQAVFLMTMAVEVLMYTLGASFPVLAPFLVAHVKPEEFTPNSSGSWRAKLSKLGIKKNRKNLSGDLPMHTDDVSDKPMEAKKNAGIVGVKKIAADRVQGWSAAMASTVHDDERQYEPLP